MDTNNLFVSNTFVNRLVRTRMLGGVEAGG